MNEFVKAWLAVVAMFAYFGTAAALTYLAFGVHDALGVAVLFLAISPIVTLWILDMEAAQTKRRNR